MKTIFEKAYLIKTQALNAAAKAVASGELVEGTFSLEQEGKKWKIVAIEVATVELGAAEADKLANASMGVDAAKPRISICERPTKKVWDIADSMPKASRKDVMAECVRQDIAYGTARTQYQAWFKASQECDRMDIRKPYEKAEK